MWSRSDLKSRAKEVLRVNYWKAFLVSLVIVFVGAGHHSPVSLGGRSQSVNTPLFSWNVGSGTRSFFWRLDPDPVTLTGLVGALIGVAALAFLVGLALRFLLGAPLEVGARRFFLRAAQGDSELDNLGYSFRDERYQDIVMAIFWRALMNFLWFLLLIIPGIVKSYAYRMVPYILGDNPHIGYRRALELSELMTEGHKMDMFILDLSFIGWYLLGALTLGIGTFFVHPYVNATWAELYIDLRRNGLDNAMTTTEELCLSPAD